MNQKKKPKNKKIIRHDSHTQHHRTMLRMIMIIIGEYRLRKKSRCRGRAYKSLLPVTSRHYLLVDCSVVCRLWNEQRPPLSPPYAHTQNAHSTIALTHAPWTHCRHGRTYGRTYGRTTTLAEITGNDESMTAGSFYSHANWLVVRGSCRVGIFRGHPTRLHARFPFLLLLFYLYFP